MVIIKHFISQISGSPLGFPTYQILLYRQQQHLDKFTELRKATFSFVMPVQLSVRPSFCPLKQLGSH